MARPTKSNGFYIQMVGRGLRKHPGKENCLILDFADQYHNLNTVISLSKAIPEAKNIDEARPMVVREKIDRKPRIETLEDIDSVFDILGVRPSFLWIDIGDYELSLVDDDNNEIVIQPRGHGFMATIFYKNGTANSITSSPVAIDHCIAMCESFARRNLKVTYADLRKPWLEVASQQPATQAQRNVLEKCGVFKHGLSKADASVEIRTFYALQSKKDRRCCNDIAARQKTAQERSLFASR